MTSLFTFAIMGVRSGNLLAEFKSREEADAYANQLRELNPDMDADDVAVLAFDEKGTLVDA